MAERPTLLLRTAPTAGAVQCHASVYRAVAATLLLKSSFVGEADTAHASNAGAIANTCTPVHSAPDRPGTSRDHGAPGDAPCVTVADTQDGAPLEALEAWARRFFAIVDTRDPDRIAAHFAADIRLAFGNRPVVVGREVARAAFASTAKALQGVRHDVTGIWHGRDGAWPVASVESTVTYTLADGRRVSVPAVSTLRLRDGLIADYRIFIDTTPVFGPA